jgi:hypothetical protein
MKNNKPVFESFNEFIKFIYEADQLNEGETTGYAGKLAGILSGGMKLQGQNKGNTETLVTDYLNKYYNASVPGTKEMADTLIQDLSYAFDKLNNKVIRTTPGVVSKTILPTTYEYLTDGVVKAEGHANLETTFEYTGYDDKGYTTTGLVGNYTIGDRVDETQTLPLSYLLAAVNAHNFNAFVELVDMAAGYKKGDTIVNYGDKADLKGYLKWSTGTSNENKRFFQMDSESLGGNIIQFTDYKPKGTAPGWGWQFPIYVASFITAGGGSLVDASTYDEVIQPAGNSVEVSEKEYNAPPETKFFDANEVTISEDGKASLNAILSAFNSIDKILVNGGASSSKTNREGGNEQLAKDRQAAGITELNALKESGVLQLKETVIEAGTAKVQDAAEKSDPTNQQVSFIISGKIKSTKVVETKPVIIQNVETIKGDAVQFTEYVFNIMVNAEPNFKTLGEA